MWSFLLGFHIFFLFLSRAPKHLMKAPDRGLIATFGHKLFCLCKFPELFSQIFPEFDIIFSTDISPFDKRFLDNWIKRNVPILDFRGKAAPFLRLFVFAGFSHSYILKYDRRRHLLKNQGMQLIHRVSKDKHVFVYSLPTHCDASRETHNFSQKMSTCDHDLWASLE